jgi:hypothetical protein
MTRRDSRHYLEPEKHRGPVASGKLLTDDWGKGDKH